MIGGLWIGRLWWVFDREEREGVGEGVRWGLRGCVVLGGTARVVTFVGSEPRYALGLDSAVGRR